MRICPQCGVAYPHGTDRCDRDGSFLENMSADASESEDLVGTTIAGRFEILERIGTGGMGTIYRASQPALRREVALKILRRELSSDPDTVTRFHREAKAMSVLAHPNTVRVFDFGQTDDGLLFIAMELLRGHLLTRASRSGSITQLQAARWAQAILGSLQEAHHKHIIHRDLKPDNIFLANLEGQSEPVVKVLDFGIAKVIHSDKALDQLETQAGTVFGTPRYMSPEQAQGKPLDERSDLYSVGVLLYQMLSGSPPFIDDDAVVVMAKHIREKPVDPRRRAPERNIAPGVAAVTMRLLAKSPKKRFQDAAEAIAALEACMGEIEAISSQSRVRVYLPGGSGFRRVATIGVPLALLGGALLAASLAWGMRQSDSDSKSADTPPTLAHNTAQPASTAPTQTAAESPTSTAGAEHAETAGAEHAETDGTVPAILASVPEGAEVWEGETRLGDTPLTLPLLAGQTRNVELRMDGYRPATGKLVADSKARVVVMQRIPRRAKSTSRAGGSKGQSTAKSDPYTRFD